MSTEKIPSNDGKLSSWLGRHRWAMRLVLAVIMPVLFLAGLELALRLVGFGYDWHMFLRVPETSFHGSNATFGQRFFSRAIARKPVPGIFTSEKGPQTYRIFVLGASAAAGIPNSAFSFGQILDVMLESQYPDLDFETVIASVTAINSHVVLPIVEECVAYEPDLFIIYLGNNEVIGPFSAGSSEARRQTGLKRIRAGIALRKTKVGQLLQTLAGRLRGEDELLTEWQGMTMFSDNFLAEDDPALDVVAEQFQANLRDMVRTADRAGTPTLLCTVAVNLRDTAPFASLHRSGLATTDRFQWEEHFAAANTELAAGRAAAAIALYRQAEAIDDRYAALHYQFGHALLVTGATDEATGHFIQARDLDALRFRTDSRLNEVIRGVAASEAAADLQLLDLEAAVADWSRARDSVPGEEIFFEHVHFNFEGNYLVARGLMDGVVAHLPAAIRAAGPRAPEPPTAEQCAAALALTDWNDYDMLSQIFMMVRGRPFTNQINHGERLAKITDELELLRADAGRSAPEDLIRAYRRALASRPEDLLIRFNYAKLLGNLGQSAAAERELLFIADRQPGMDLEPPEPPRRQRRGP